MAGNPFRTLCFERLDLVLGGAVELLARDVLINLRRPFPVRTVRAAEVAGVGFANGAVFLAVASKGAGTGISSAGATIETARCAVLAVAAAGTVAAITERLPVLSPAEAAPVSLAVTARTITKRLLVPVTIRLTVTVTERLPLTATAEGLTVTVTKGLPLTATAEGLTVTVTKGLPLTATAAAPVTLAVTARTITKWLLVPVAIRLTVTVTKGLPLTATAAAPVTLAVTARTITKRLLVTIAIRLTVTVTERLPLTATAEGLTVTVTKGLPLATAAGGTSGRIAALTVAAGAKTPGIPA
ncbi:hypothetical protein [Arthrobacter sp. OY3WO11]|uniref:hypothetical protein n=1 Tax=Arthrobacter sp. OY3WO11 TaxID=1835723 RepID=UPI002570460D|nr:hypothetical protein [Arthrobacter sp. OY3WO11]